LHRQWRIRRACGFDAVLHALPLPAGFRELQHGVRLGHGLDTADSDRPGDRCELPVLQILGRLRGRCLMRTRTRTGVVNTPRRRLGRTIALHLLLAVLALAMVYPLLWMIVSSLRDNDEIFR